MANMVDDMVADMEVDKVADNNEKKLKSTSPLTIQFCESWFFL